MRHGNKEFIMSQKNNNRKGAPERIIEQIMPKQRAPVSLFFFLLLLYVIANTLTMIAGSRTDMITLLGVTLPINAFAGVFSSLANICVILLAVFCGKLGFWVTVLLLGAQVPVSITRVFMEGNVRSLPGIFSNLLTIIAVTAIFFKNKKAEKIQKQMAEHAVTDMMTGMPNVYAITQLLNDLIAHGETFTNVTINLNSFKNLNDMMGMEVGNLILIEAGMRWKQIADSGETGTQDFIAHLSGDEYALIIRNYSSAEQVLATIKRYEAALINKMIIDDHEFYVTASYGYAEYPTDAKTLNTVCSYASMAMHEIKRANSSQHILRFTPELLKSDNYLETEKEIREALKNDTFYFNLQPQFDMNHKLRGFEALARMKNASGQNVSPGVFIPVAESAGLVDRIDGAVFRKAACFFGRLIQDYGTETTLSVNVSVRHLLREGFLDEVQSILTESGVPARQIEIEITESIMIDSEDKALQIIGELKKMGIQLAIDDFGTGYSSLSYLHKFPAHLLKVDKSFIDKINSSKSSRDYVEAIISIGHIMGFAVIAEGVEQDDQLKALRETGCDFVQGYIWGRPLPPEDAEKLMHPA